MKFARWTFCLAGIYGLIVLLPLYFTQPAVTDEKPQWTHPEFYYGFVGVAIAWQVAFLIMARDPQRFRPLMVPAVLEKLSFGLAAIVLYFQQRTALPMLAGGVIDLVLAVLFSLSWWRCAAATALND